ncbi:nucleotide pyrophosphohydrolase [Parasalinivibrio latis]|uniref:nucleotide pyrophosphohydrolase n=1 Tax=Parasalinivibrio latis TaxID=2952610 RepID=UPI0030E1383A
MKNPTIHDIPSLQHALAEFANERNWEQFHTPKNLVMALSGEVGELTELFQWLTPEQSQSFPAEKKESLEHELADVMMYLLRIADICDVDLMEACNNKLQLNKEKYPVKKCFGQARKYNEL